jgi:hypothetical protein
MTQNPTKAQFTVSPDHLSVTHYELGFWTIGATDPVQVSNIGTGTPDATGVLELPLPNYPIGWTFEARIRACIGELVSPWSEVSNPFGRSPRSPSGLVIL